MRNAIPPDLEPVVLAKAGEGWSTRQIAAWLGTDHKLTASAAAVQRLLARIARDRAPVAQAITRAALASTLTRDLDVAKGLEARALADEEIARAGFAADGLSSLPGTEEWGRCMTAASRARNDAMRVVEHRAKLSGADAGGDDAAAVRARLLAKLEGGES